MTPGAHCLLLSLAREVSGLMIPGTLCTITLSSPLWMPATEQAILLRPLYLSGRVLAHSLGPAQGVMEEVRGNRSLQPVHSRDKRLGQIFYSFKGMSKYFLSSSHASQN